MPKHPDPKTFQRRLLAWYDAQKRDLPWRDTNDPYRIWVSEIMLQQTQVKTVIPYYRKWIRAFPTVRHLAEAPESRVLKHWEGLGYYSRARNLHRAAQAVVRDFAGQIPDSLDGILRLPGIGRYTAGAVLSIAFGHRVPVLDGNVKRVLSRLYAMCDTGASRESETRLWQTAESLLPSNRAGDFNQALMELGATVCLPKNPWCTLCPVAHSCQAKQMEAVDRYPPAKPRKASQKIEVSAAVIRRGQKVFIQQRPLHGLMGGLWEFPGGKRDGGETPEECLHREILEELNIGIEIEEKLLMIRHSYTQFRVTLHVYACKKVSGRLKPVECEQWKWVDIGDLFEYPFPAANVKIVEHLSSGGEFPLRRKRNA